MTTPCLPSMESLRILDTGRPVPGYENTPALLEKHAAKTGGQLYFRFPPEPNGFLHVGHAKSMFINFGGAKARGGKCYLRYDDTNPEAEEQLYIDSILEMVKWMGWNPDWVTYSSDYFEELYQLAVALIKKDKAYVDDSTAAEMRKQRELREESPCRNRPIEESLRMFEHMRQGRYDEGAVTLRVKADMKSDNPNMRDFVAYRVKYARHPHSGDKWCIYPSYDFTHCIVDALEDIDYSICTAEFESRRESYFWLLDQLDLWRPRVFEFGRLNVVGSLLSKRKINALVRKGIVRGFDDPRLLTLAGMRRRGYTPHAINHFCELTGITRSGATTEMTLLENCLREHLDEVAPRRQLVIDPILVVVDNWQGEKEVECANHPRKPELGARRVKFTDRFYIDRSDFRATDDDKQFYGVAPGPRPVGLKFTGNIVCTSFERDADGRPSVVHVNIDFERAEKPKTNISWVSAAEAVPVELRLYAPLLTEKGAPDSVAVTVASRPAAADEEEADAEADGDDGKIVYINKHSEVVSAGFIEKSGDAFAVGDTIQAERFAYFTVDVDSTPEHLVLNRVVSLKEDKAKVDKGAERAALMAAKAEKKRLQKEKQAQAEKEKAAKKAAAAAAADAKPATE